MREIGDKTTMLWIACVCLLLFVACSNNSNENEQNNKDHAIASTESSTLKYVDEVNLKNMKQLTFGGNNAEAYFSFDGKYLSFQSDYEAWGASCDQIFYMPIGTEAEKSPALISKSGGRTTCAYFMPGDKQILYASTHLSDAACPPKTPRVVNGKYVWPVHNSYDIFVADLKGEILKQLTNEPGYDAEATVSPDGKKIVFTSTRSGDLELWTMNVDGTDLNQVTNELGYDGGAFFSPDNKRLIFRASRPKTEDEIKVYKELLDQGLVQPVQMELFICNVDGTELKQITNLGKANWAPYFHPSGEKVVFSSNHKSESGRQFNLFMINIDGTGLTQITFDAVFDAFPMFSPDGKYLAFSSNRNNNGTHDTNVFIAEWVD